MHNEICLNWLGGFMMCKERRNGSNKKKKSFSVCEIKDTHLTGCVPSRCGGKACVYCGLKEIIIINNKKSKEFV